MPTKRSYAIWTVVVLVIIAGVWLRTLGLAILDYRWYGGSTPFEMQEGPRLHVYIDTRVRQLGIPFLVTYSTDSLPYGINLCLHDNRPTTVRTLVLEEVTVVYPDGSATHVISPEDNWSKEFEEDTIVNSSPQGLVYTDIRIVEHHFSGVVKRASDFQLRLAGWYIFQDGSRIPIKIAMENRLERVRRFKTGWAHMGDL